ncbi:putative DinB family protein [Serratia marcescens]|uniref:DinB family protein n=2 Tax=Serratia marcescens TaxID=615 RepID=UPI003AFDD419
MSATAIDTLKMLVRYKAWANALTFDCVAALPEGEALRPRPTRFGNMVHTLNHVYVVDDIFRHHLQGRKHGYLARNTEQTPALGSLRCAVEEMDRWYIEQVDNWSPEALAQVVHFEFVGGGGRPHDAPGNRAACRQPRYLSSRFCRRYALSGALCCTGERFAGVSSRSLPPGAVRRAG